MFDSELCRIWKNDRDRHPFVGEKLSSDEMKSCWESASNTYTDRWYKGMKDDIIAHLEKIGILGKNKSMIDIGSGPGIYAIPMCQYMKYITCLDASPGMLSRLRDECAKQSIDNIMTKEADWDEYVSERKYDVAFSSLCPPVNTPESILKMESCAIDDCVYISSANVNTGIHIMIWNELGRDYSYHGYHTKYPCKFLKECGRKPELKMFSEHISYETTVEDAIANESRLIGKYRKVDDKISTIVREIVESHSSDGIIKTDEELRLGLLTWKPL